MTAVPWFVALPDSQGAAVAARWATSAGTQVHLHPSGRPWLVGRWVEGECVVAEAGESRLAVIGSSPIVAEQLGRAARRHRGMAALDAFAMSLPGSFHLVASQGGCVRVQGGASGLRLVFHASVDGVTVGADRPDVLASLLGAELDECQVAMRLLSTPLHPVMLTPPWRRVTAVDPGAYLSIGPDGRARQVRWWSPPVPAGRLSAGAPRVREALAEAVATYTRGRGTVSCDLSGGMDSTAVCFLATRGKADVVASTFSSGDAADEDVAWARRATVHLTDVEHLVVPAEQIPGPYQHMDELHDVPDEPTLAVLARQFWTRRLPELASRGSRVHLTGIGGDHVTWCSPAHYHRLLRRRPRLALRELRGFRALFHWPLGETLRALADNRPYPRWLADAADDLLQPPPRLGNTLGWAVPPRLPGWVTPAARDTVRQALLAEAARVEPLAADRGQHADLVNIRSGARLARQLEQIGARLGVPIVSPFFHDRVVAACLEIRPEDRVSAWRYRPVLVTAMRGVVPGECLERTTKAVGTVAAARAVDHHRAELLALWDGSRLAEMGLVDEGRLRAAVRSSMPEWEQQMLDVTISVELWLRALQAKGGRHGMATSGGGFQRRDRVRLGTAGRAQR